MSLKVTVNGQRIEIMELISYKITDFVHGFIGFHLAFWIQHHHTLIHWSPSRLDHPAPRPQASHSIIKSVTHSACQLSSVLLVSHPVYGIPLVISQLVITWPGGKLDSKSQCQFKCLRKLNSHTSSLDVWLAHFLAGRFFNSWLLIWLTLILSRCGHTSTVCILKRKLTVSY